MENNKELFESIFNRSIEATDTGSYLENIVEAYPYFSPAQFYLLLQTKKDNASYKKQVQKITVLFNNKYWLNYLLTSRTRQHPLFTESFFENAETIADIRTAPGSAAEIPVDTKELPARSISSETISTTSDETEEPGFAADKVVDESALSVNELTVEDESTGVNQPVMVNDEPVAISIDDTNAAATESAPLSTEDAGKDIIEEPAPGGNASANTVVAANDMDIKPIADVQEEALLFQPLHTSDYFASVGIKLSEEVNASDKLGKQLKSFTQWLKTMKKIDTRHAEPLLPSELSENTDSNNIQKLAESSNIEDEIITEAMADVLVQQGRIHKAVEVLKKLSLLNPSKSTYFAAKIEQLKD